MGLALLTTLTLLTALAALALLITNNTTCTIYNNYVLQYLHVTYDMYIIITQKREQDTVCNHQKNYCAYIILIAKAATYFVSIWRELYCF